MSSPARSGPAGDTRSGPRSVRRPASTRSATARDRGRTSSPSQADGGSAAPPRTPTSAAPPAVSAPRLAEAPPAASSAPRVAEASPAALSAARRSYSARVIGLDRMSRATLSSAAASASPVGESGWSLRTRRRCAAMISSMVAFRGTWRISYGSRPSRSRRNGCIRTAPWPGRGLGPPAGQLPPPGADTLDVAVADPGEEGQHASVRQVAPDADARPPPGSARRLWRTRTSPVAGASRRSQTAPGAAPGREPEAPAGTR